LAAKSLGISPSFDGNVSNGQRFGFAAGSFGSNTRDATDIPNFAPVAAIALFAGYYLRSSLMAALVPLSIMTITDWFIGGYDLRVMVTVYAMLTLPVFFRSMIRSRFGLAGESRLSAGFDVLGLFTCGLASSILFFVLTNFAVWVFFDYYDSSLAGLGRCYLRALPFFRFTLAGDAFFSLVLFGGYAIATRYMVVTRSRETLSPAMVIAK
jgi:hypothetical protein